MRTSLLFTALLALCVNTQAVILKNTGTFDIASHRIIRTRDAFLKEASKAHASSRTVRALALVGSQFKADELKKYGWRYSWQFDDVAVLEGPSATLPYLTALDGILYVKKPERVYPCLDSARHLTGTDDVHSGLGNLPGRYTGKGVLVGIIDNEFDTHHPAFKDSTGTTKFAALWDQRDTSKTIANVYGYGIIKNHRQLLTDSLFGLGTGKEIHGTYMAGLAAGGDRSVPYYGTAPDAMLIGVRHTGEDNDIIDAIKWIFSVADSLKVPCVINMSIGSAAGPHDGTSLIDRAIDFHSRAGRIIVGAAGNDFDKKTHASFILKRGETKGTWITPAVETQPNSSKATTYSGLDIWGLPSITLNASFTIMDTVTGSSIRTSRSLTTFAKGEYLDTIYWPSSTNRKDTLLLYAITERSSPLNSKEHMQIMMLGTNPLLRLGVTFSITATSTDTVHVWNTTKNALKSFGMADYTDGDTVCSVNEVGGTSRRNITVGSYYNNLIFHLWNGRTKVDMAEVNHSITLYTGVGPTIDGRNKPDIVAPGSNVVGSLSRMASATGGDSDIVIWPNPPDPIGRYACTGGTSIASPIAAGIVALMLQAKPDLLPDSAKAILQRTAIRDQWSGKLANWSSRWGAGKVNALGAIQAVLGMPVTGAGTYRVPAVLNYAFDAHNRIIRIVRSGDRDAGASRCLLYTMNGRLLMSVSLKDKSEFILPLKITRGTYLLVLKSGSVQCVRRISVQK